MSRFNRAFAIVVGHEGGYVNHPHDPGGETNWGISKRSYPALDIAALTIESARLIYRRDYWDRCQCDAAVNNGVAQASRWLQAVVGTTQDGVIGRVTLARAGTDRRGALDVAAEVHARRLLMMVALPGWATFGGGWARRLALLPLQAGAFGA